MNRTLSVVVCTVIVYTAILAFTGCDKNSPPAPAAVPKTGATTGGKTEAKTDDAGHVHGAGPHGGTLTDWGGGEYHVEFTADHDKKEATVYIIGSDEKSKVAIKAERIHLLVNDPMTEMELVAKPLEGEAEGTSSRFVGTHDTIGIERMFSGTISGQIDGTPYTGDFQEEPHEADHKH